MQTIKNRIIKIIEKLPNDAEYNDIFEAIYLQQKIEIGLEQSRNNEGVSHEEVKKRFEKWLR